MKIGIIGAGVAGMSAAWDLVAAGHHVTIFESEARVGGLAGGFRDEGWAWSLEKFYHHWFETDRDLLALAEAMGVREKILFPRPKTSYWIDGRLYRSEISPSALALPLSPLAKLRFGAAGAFIKLTPDWKSLENVTADAWLRRNMGEEAYGKFFRPLLIGKFGAEYDKVNMAWMWARVKARSLRLGTYQGGFQAFLDALAAQLEQRGVALRLNTPIEALAQAPDGVQLTAGGQAHLFDRVLATTSPGLLLRLAPALRDTSFGAGIAALRSIGAVCVILATRRKLLTDDTYWLNLPASSPDKAANRFPFLALVEHTNWMDPVHYNGDRILYMGDYVPVDHEYFQLGDEALIQRFSAVLPVFNPAFRADWVRRAWVFRAPYAQPVPYVGHSSRVPPVRTPIPGLYWASMSHVYPWDRGTNYAVEIGRRAARELLGE